MNLFSWKNIRKIFNKIHLYGGLVSGLVLIVVCLTGTLYVYNTELTEWSAPHLYKAGPVSGNGRIPVEQLIPLVESASGGKVTGIVIPASPERNYQFNVRKKDDNSRNGTGYFVDPYSGKIAGNNAEPNRMKEFMRDMFSLHRWLMLDRVEKPIVSGMTNRELGSFITGWATILFTIGCITGLVIWFPPRIRNWKQGLKIKFRANWKRVNHDLHNTLAFYSLIFLLLMGLTGPFWSFPWYREGLQKTLGTYKPQNTPAPEEVKSTPTGDGKTVSLSEILSKTNETFPFNGDVSIAFPGKPDGVITVSKYRSGFFAPAAADKLMFDSYSGELLKKDIFSEKPFNQRVAGSIKALHVGNVYGGFTKLLYFFACLIATSLPITGTLIWINKFKKKPKTVKNRSLELRLNN